MTTRYSRVTRIVTLFVILVNLLGACTGGATTPTLVPPPLPKPTIAPPEFPKTVDLNTELEIQGAAIKAGEAKCPQLLAGMENGIVLGVDPATCEAAQSGNPTTASIKLKLSNQYVRHVFSLKIAWRMESERGLRAVLPDRTAEIEWDGQVIWKKSALPPLKNDYYYAAQSEPILVTFVPQTLGAHEIKITVPPGMSWDIDSIQIIPTPYPQNLLGLAYSPYRDCQDANTVAQPSQQDMESDLAILRQNATAIRTYSAIGTNYEIPRLANEMGIPVYAGAWLDGNIESDNEEMAGIFDIARISQIEAAIIGNEYHLRHM
jgi:hypothetical protein